VRECSVLQVRTEKDWRLHPKIIAMVITDFKDNELCFMKILIKVSKTFPNLRLIYVSSGDLCDVG
jgi:hypothetical protein